MNSPEKINQLLVRLDALLKRQEDFSKEIRDLQQEIQQLKTFELREEPLDSSNVFETEVEADEEIFEEEYFCVSTLLQFSMFC